MTKQSYRVTEKAGPWVAGRRNPGSEKTLELTEPQARYALIARELVPVEAKPVKAKKAPAAPASPAPGSEA